MATDIRYQEAMNVNKAMRKKQKELEEKYDVEFMTVAIMEIYLSLFDMKMHLDRGPGADMINYSKSLEEKSGEDKKSMEQFINKEWYGECNAYLE